jgi:cytochrome c5
MKCFILLLSFFSSQVNANSHHPQEFIRSINGSKNEGEQIYKHFCINCHSKKPVISLGAPRIGEEVDWKLRFKQGMDVLFKHTDEGFNSMPSRGGCFECTDKQLMRAILYMLPKQAKKTLTK